VFLGMIPSCVRARASVSRPVRAAAADAKDLFLNLPPPPPPSPSRCGHQNIPKPRDFGGSTRQTYAASRQCRTSSSSYSNDGNDDDDGGDAVPPTHRSRPKTIEVSENISRYRGFPAHCRDDFCTARVDASRNHD